MIVFKRRSPRPREPRRANDAQHRLARAAAALETAAAELRKAVAESADLEAMPLAEALVAAAALNAKLAKLAGEVRPQLAPLFKRPDAGDDQAGGGKPRPRK